MENKGKQLALILKALRLHTVLIVVWIAGLAIFDLKVLKEVDVFKEGIWVLMGIHIAVLLGLAYYHFSQQRREEAIAHLVLVPVVATVVTIIVLSGS